MAEKLNKFSQWVAKNLAWAVLVIVFYWAVGLVSAFFFAIFAYDSGLAWHWLILLTALVFYAVTGGLISASKGGAEVAERFRKRRRGEADTTAEGTSIVKDHCPEKWLHDIAKNEKNFIEQYVKVTGCEIFQHQLFDLTPHAIFKFILLNVSVYPISIEDSVTNKVYFDSRLLSKELKIIENAAIYCEHGKEQYFLLCLWLSKEEVTCILNAMDDADEFKFWPLHIPIKSGSNEHEIISKKLDLSGASVSSKPMRERYPKLKTGIRKAIFREYWNWDAIMERGMLINMFVSITNPRKTLVDIQTVKIIATVLGVTFVAYAETGELREHRLVDDNHGDVSIGEILTSLPTVQPILEGGAPREGWVQFLIRERVFSLDITEDAPSEIPATLIITAASGEEHHTECLLNHEDFRPLSRS